MISDYLERYKKYPYALEIPRQIADGSLLDTDKLVVLVFDALGRTNLNLPFLKRETYRTVFPSLTPAFFYSFHSLLDPGQHGYIGMRMWYEKVNDVVAVPPWVTTHGVDLNDKLTKRDVFPWEPLFTKLTKRGYSTTYFIEWPEQAFARSVGKDSIRLKHKYLADLARVNEVDTDVVYVYNYLMDALKHKYLGGSEVTMGAKLIETLVRQVWKGLDKGTRLIIMSDHGQTKINKLIGAPDIGNMPPTGGGNIVYLRNPDEDKMNAMTRKYKDISVHSIDELKDVYDGRLSPKIEKRYGDTILLSHNGLSFSFSDPHKPKLGTHGGVSPDEMLVYVWDGIK